MRREPPRFRRVQAYRITQRSPHLISITFTGHELDGLEVDQPAASVRLLLPSPGSDALVMPEWDGNEFLLPDGDRPIIRTFTPRRFDPDGPSLDLEVVLHDGGIASQWAAAASEGAEAAISGTGRGFAIDADTPAYVLGGDESAIPAISQLLEVIPEAVPVDVHVEVSRPDARVELPTHPAATVSWYDLPDGTAHGDALVEAIVAAEIVTDTHVWVAGEAAAVQRIRKHLSDERDHDRSLATVRGYWKHGR